MWRAGVLKAKVTPPHATNANRWAASPERKSWIIHVLTATEYPPIVEIASTVTGISKVILIVYSVAIRVRLKRYQLDLVLNLILAIFVLNAQENILTPQ